MNDRIKRIFKLLSLKKEKLETNLYVELLETNETTDSNRKVIKILEKINKTNESIKILSEYINVDRNNGNEPTR